MPIMNDMFTGGWNMGDEPLCESPTTTSMPKKQPVTRMVMEIVGEGDFPSVEEDEENEWYDR